MVLDAVAPVSGRCQYEWFVIYLHSFCDGYRLRLNIGVGLMLFRSTYLSFAVGTQITDKQFVLFKFVFLFPFVESISKNSPTYERMH